MKTNKWFRQHAWHKLWSDGWFGRLFWGGIALGCCSYFVQMFLASMLSSLVATDWGDYLLAVVANSQDLTTPIPNLTNEFIIRATMVTCFELFIVVIMSSLVTFGTAVIRLRCLRNQKEGWFKHAFSGYLDPFGMGWLLVRLELSYVFWCLISFGLLFFIPFYRYRYLWLVKVEHPEWSASQCFQECRKIMKGQKWRSFSLDCSYWLQATLLMLALVLMGVFPMLSIIALPIFIVLVQHIAIGQTALYEDIRNK